MTGFSPLVKMNKSLTERTLFGIHPGGGLTVPYIPFAKGLEKEVSFVGLQAPELFSDNIFCSMDEQVYYYIDLIKRHQESGPYLLFGWSYGAAIAYEIASELYKSGDEIAYLCLLDFPPKTTHSLSDKSELWSEVLRRVCMGRINLGCSPLNVMAEEDVVDFCIKEFDRQSVPLLSVCGSRIRFIRYIINEAHRFINYEASRSSLNFDLFMAEISSADTMMRSMLGISDTSYHKQWEDYTSGAIRCINLGGSHHGIIASPYVNTITDAMRTKISSLF